MVSKLKPNNNGIALLKITQICMHFLNMIELSFRWQTLEKCDRHVIGCLMLIITHRKEWLSWTENHRQDVRFSARDSAQSCDVSHTFPYVRYFNFNHQLSTYIYFTILTLLLVHIVLQYCASDWTISLGWDENLENGNKVLDTSIHIIIYILIMMHILCIGQSSVCMYWIQFNTNFTKTKSVLVFIQDTRYDHSTLFTFQIQYFPIIYNFVTLGMVGYLNISSERERESERGIEGERIKLH